MILFFILILLLTVGCDSYICFGVIKSWPIWARLLWWLPTVAFFVCFAIMARGNWGWPATALVALLICCVLPNALFCLCSLIGRAIALAHAPAAGWANITGIAIAAIVCLCGIYGVGWGWKRLTVKDITIESATLPPAFDGYRIVQLSDLHLGTFGSDSAHVGRMVDMVNALHPDLIVFTGDLVNFTYRELKPFEAQLSRLHARDGVLSILGNHDYALYAARGDDQADRLVDTLITAERAMGWRMLLDENVAVARGSDTIWIAGVQNIGHHFSANKGDLAKALRGIPAGAYTVLLSHDPTHWDDAVAGKLDIPLTLSGHTHSMQLSIFGWSPSAWVFPHYRGLYHQGAQALYVSPGTGGNLPFRFGAWPEITLLTLRHSD